MRLIEGRMGRIVLGVLLLELGATAIATAAAGATQELLLIVAIAQVSLLLLVAGGWAMYRLLAYLEVRLSSARPRQVVIGLSCVGIATSALLGSRALGERHPGSAALFHILSLGVVGGTVAFLGLILLWPSLLVVGGAKGSAKER